jgi:hypothetical protein
VETHCAAPVSPLFARYILVPFANLPVKEVSRLQMNSPSFIDSVVSLTDIDSLFEAGSETKIVGDGGGKY